MDEPAQAGTPWGLWLARQLTPVLGSPVAIDDVSSPVVLTDGEVSLAPGITSAGIYSPVLNIGGQYGVIRSIDFSAWQDTTPAAGSREIIDADQSTPRREVRIRTHTEDFVQDPTITPPDFENQYKQVKFSTRARYVQLELVLRSDGD